jgi:site-specific recombinase XerD
MKPSSRRAAIKGILREGDPRAVRVYVSMMARESFAPTSIREGRLALLRYIRWLRAHGQVSVEKARLKEFVSYRNDTLRKPIARTTAYGYIHLVSNYYRLRLQRQGREQDVELWRKMEVMGRVSPVLRGCESTQPFSPETLRRILTAARSYTHLQYKLKEIPSEDFTFIMLLLYTGARASIYGLRVNEIDFGEGVIRTHVKGGKFLIIPLHPKLARVLRHHLATREYQSEYVFRNGKDPDTFRGGQCNRDNADTICKRVQAAAGLTESVHAHRFRATLATVGRSMGMSLEHIKTILGHQDARTTLNHYLKPQMDEVRRDLAVVNFASGTQTGWRSSIDDAVGRMQRLAPPGTEHAMALIARGLSELMDRGPRQAW